MKKLRKLWESIVYAGLRPRSATPAPRTGRTSGPLRARWERFLAGGAPADPLYLTNRNIFQKAGPTILVSLACLVVIGLVALGAGHYFHVREKPVYQPTPAEIAQATLPDLVKGVQISTDHDLEVPSARIQRGSPTMLVGEVKNNAGYSMSNVRVVFTLTTETGTKLGAAAIHLDRVDAKSTAPFSQAIEQENAFFALVREIHHQ